MGGVDSLGQKLPARPDLGSLFCNPCQHCINVECFSESLGKLPGASWVRKWKTSTLDLCLAKNSVYQLRYAMAFYFNISFLRTEALGRSHRLTQPAFRL